MNGCLVASLTLIFAASVAVHEEFIRLAQNAEQKGISSALSNHGKPVILWRLTARARALDGPGLGEGRTALALAQVSWRVFLYWLSRTKKPYHARWRDLTGSASDGVLWPQSGEPKACRSPTIRWIL